MNEILNLAEYRNWLSDLKQQIKVGQIKAAFTVNSQMIMLYWDMGRQIAEKQETAKWGSGLIKQLSKDLKAEFPEMKGFSQDNLAYMKKFYFFYAPISEQFVPILQRAYNEEVTISEQVVRKLGNPIVEQLVQQLHPVDNQNNTIVAQPVPQLQNSDNHIDTIWKQPVSKLISIPWGHHIKIMQKVKDLDQALFYINKTIENNWSRAVLEYHIEDGLYGKQGKAITNFNLTL
ncbi:MAG: DUF1016 N-terminal domain-containing protein, partial [Bacteroidales bacterium]|nr:DUF1016 N-terminal domain-containing protein [Bacteroidales bacterium]